LSPEISINLQVRSAIRLFWHNVPSALARVKNAMVALRTAAGIASGWSLPMNLLRYKHFANMLNAFKLKKNFLTRNPTVFNSNAATFAAHLRYLDSALSLLLPLFS
jgi:hypothetical protein